MGSGVPRRHLHLSLGGQKQHTDARRLAISRCDGVRQRVRKQIMATICVINDDPSLVTLLADLLSDREEDSVVCCDSREAYQCLERGDVDLVIVDLLTKKPEGGWDILTYLQMHPRLRHLPTIVCSGVTDELLSKEEWLRQHNISVLEKPFELEELYRCVDTVLGRSSPASV